MKYKVGDKVRVRRFDERPGCWNAEGKMDKYMGKIVTIKSIFLPGTIQIVEDQNEGSGWLWSESDFEPVKFDWDAFINPKSRIAVHCKTEEEAKDFCKKMHEHGMEWCSGRSYKNETKWHVYKKRHLLYSRC